MAVVAPVVGAAAVLAAAANVAAKRTFLYPHGTWERLLASRVVQLAVSNGRRDRQRAAQEARRVKQGGSHVLIVYYAPDDAHSHVLLHALLQFLERYSVELRFLVLDGGHGHSTSPVEQRAWQRRDAVLLAELYGFPFPGAAGADGGDEDGAPVGGPPPSAAEVSLVARATLAAQDALLLDPCSLEHQQAFLKSAVELGAALFGSRREREEGAGKLAQAAEKVAPAAAGERLRRNAQALAGAGHYLSGMLEYAGEFYWGIDRLRHLEERLRGLPGAVRASTPPAAALFGKTYELRFLGPEAPEVAGTPSHPLELFYSPRSPYSQLAVDRCIGMARFYGVELLIRPVFPMVMRKLSVPTTKKFYIIRDMKRESDAWGFPFAQSGFKDPLWEPTYRFMALWPYVEQQSKTKEFTQAFAHGVYCDGVDFGTDRGAARVAEKAGLDPAECLRRLREAEDAASVDANGDDTRLASEPARSNVRIMTDAGLWGVPCLRYGSLFVWGADRLWAIEAAILRDPGLRVSARSKV